MSREDFSLPERVTLDHAQEALSLAASLNADVDLQIDASEVVGIDGGAVIALANIARSFAAQAEDPEASRSKGLAVFKPTPAFVDAFSDLGLFQDLMKMEFRK